MSLLPLEDLPVLGPLGRKIGRGAANELYPVRHRRSQLSRAAEAIRRAGQKYHISPAYIWGIFGTETSYGSDIKTSSTGAKGPFQFEPATARQFGYPLGANERSITDWRAFEKQAEATARFLAAHNGTAHPQKAIEAYNPGEASYFSKVVEHAKSFVGPYSPLASEAANKAETSTTERPKEPSVLEGIASLAVKGILLLAGAVLMIYGVMVAVRPRERDLAIRAFPIPLPV